MSEARPAGTLFVVGTPIGNLEDVTLRALDVLGKVAVIAAEDTRVTARLLARHGISTPLASLREQNAARAIPGIIGRLADGEDVAVVSDAGTPAVSDPGVDLVAAAADAGIRITPIPGPSALAAAVSVAGLRGFGVRFVGFLPRGGRRRKDLAESLADESALIVLYESPRRLAGTLRDLAATLGERRAVVLRELTKVHEEVARGTLADLAERFGGEVLGEVTVAIEGREAGPAEELTDERLVALIREELGRGRSARDAAASLAQGLGVPRKRVYDLAVRAVSRG